MIKIEETLGGNEYGARYKVKVLKDGKEVDGFSACSLSDCPEDASLERDLHYAYSAVDFFKLGYEAGKNNETVEFVELKEEDDD